MSQSEDFSDVVIERSPGERRLGLGGRLVAHLIRDIRHGHLTIMLPSGALVKRTGAEPGPEATIVIRNWRMLRRVVVAGDIGFAEAFIEGDWTTPDLTAVIRLSALNSETLSPAINGNFFMRGVNRIRHLLNANTKKGSRRNIEAHYDLGNAFYQEWLDASMLYSSAIFDETTLTLEDAQRKRLDRIRKKLAPSGGDKVLEIGCGWGALAVDLALNGKVDVVGITLSPSQLARAQEMAEKHGQSGQVDLRLQDYRDADGQYDRIVSIEMFEAVGEAYWPSYFATIKRCLKPQGRTVLQIISIEQNRFEHYRGSIDFIQKYVFPGGFLPSDKALDAAVSAAGLKLVDVEHFGQSYARTLREWRSRFHARWPAIAALGFDERFRRLWHYYLSYCEAGFEEGCIDVGLYTIEHA